VAGGVKLLDIKGSEDSFRTFLHKVCEVEVYLSHSSSARPRTSLPSVSALPAQVHSHSLTPTWWKW